MKVVILAGGFGTRISEESHLKPKPMIEIGEKPILWHIMKEYSAYGINEFIICAGYKQHVAALVIACIYAVGINWKLIKMFFAEIRKYKKEGN